MDNIGVVFQVGPFGVTRTVVTTWGIMLLMAGASWLATRRLSVAGVALIMGGAVGNLVDRLPTGPDMTVRP